MDKKIVVELIKRSSMYDVIYCNSGVEAFKFKADPLGKIPKYAIVKGEDVQFVSGNDFPAMLYTACKKEKNSTIKSFTTSAFRVKDQEEFLIWVSPYKFEVIDRDGLFSLFSFDNQFPGLVIDHLKADDFIRHLSSHLVNGWRVFIRESSIIEGEFINATWMMINDKGESIIKDLDDFEEEFKFSK